VLWGYAWRSTRVVGEGMMMCYDGMRGGVLGWLVRG